MDVGLTPYEALKTSTTNPFEFLGELEDAGTIEVGKRADLLLLKANHLEKISNTKNNAGVMIQGYWLSKTELQEGIEEVVSYYEISKTEVVSQYISSAGNVHQDHLGIRNPSWPEELTCCGGLR